MIKIHLQNFEISYGEKHKNRELTAIRIDGEAEVKLGEF